MFKLRQAIKFKLAGFYSVGLWRFFCLFIFILAIPFFFSQPALATSDKLHDSLQQQLNYIEGEINQYQAQIAESQNQAKTLKKEIQLLDNKIKKTGLELQQSELVLAQTKLDIEEKNNQIEGQEKKLNMEQDLLISYLQNIYEFDQQSVIASVFSQKKLSDIFGEVNTLDSMQQKTYDTIDEMKKIKEDLQNQKDELAQKKQDELDLEALQEFQQAVSLDQQNEKKMVLVQTKGGEAAYQKLLAQSKSNAAVIKKQMYLVDGVGLVMTLEEAYRHAKFAADRTGVSPALLLAVLKQESSWGTKMGTGFWRQDMNEKDRAAFIQICDELNLAPDKISVSRKPSYGWGGAMGPAQFLPSTWQIYENRVARLTGHNPPSPWNIDDAFTAAALKLANAGATEHSYDAEWKAAMVYFAGNNWSERVYGFYGDAVMDLAGVIKGQLDVIIQA